MTVAAGGFTGSGTAGSKRAAEQLAAQGSAAGAGRMTTGSSPVAGSRCGFVAVVGAPNAGKSTLVNRLAGAKLSIVTPKAQTTRFRVLGIMMRGESQVLLVDTPGIFTPRRRLDRAMVAAAWTGVRDADLTLLLVDAKAGATDAVREIAASAGRAAAAKLAGAEQGRSGAGADAAAVDRVADGSGAVRADLHGQRGDRRRHRAVGRRAGAMPCRKGRISIPMTT